MRTLLLTIIVFVYVHHIGYSADKAVVYAGGVAGIKDLLVDSASDRYRQHGGGLFLHNSGWGHLSDTERSKLLKIFKGSPIAVEIGYEGNLDGWAATLKHAYINKGINPHFVTVNIFMNKHVPTVKEWSTWHTRLKQVVGDDTLVFPTFEYANFGEHLAQLSNNTLSKSVRFQKIVEISGGFVIDVPPTVFFKREPVYRMWVIDALKYAKQKHLTSVLIVSPDKSKQLFDDHTFLFLKLLQRYKALPSVYVVENYSEDQGYHNKIGDEDNSFSILGVADKVLVALKKTKH